MRVVGGIHRGRKLIPPGGNAIRPTTDRMRETIFNILSHYPAGLAGTMGLAGARVLDVFAGTGAMGIEALSRGACHATFFDRDRKALQLVKKNIALLGLEDIVTIKSVTAPRFPPSKDSYDIIFLDPPYRLDIIPEVIHSLKENGYLAGNCMIIAEYPSGRILELPEYLSIHKEKSCGEAHISFLIYTP
ncbi:16S rRNA (guanine(966)-N(2))-methyltransferase [hydrothermal vent metagenome]|uniref:16S rRNA (Guanine(966)-N(2))-methyltransferase n=1 Tax=hydrothermal vent metagenome TaxID=652676 RepID=A0A3B0T0G7_9ZZZZ